jgi:uncharacterized UBP type Zn finger protein
VKRLVEMGFAEEDCRQALLAHKGDEAAAIEALLGSIM